MKNYIQPGNVVTLTAPTGGVVAGNAYLVGATFGVAATTVAQTLPFEASVKGVYTLVKEGAGSGQAWTAGDALYWDAAASKVTKTSAGNTLVGKAAADAITTDTTGAVRLFT